MAANWDFIRTRRVTSGRRITLPEELRDQLAYDHSLRDESIEWHVEESSGVAVVANTRLDKERYDHLQRTDVLGEDNNLIRPPDGVVEELSRPIHEDTTVVFLAHSEMLEGDVISMYLLTEGQALEMVGEGEDGKNLRDTLSDTPAFFPVPE